MRSFLPLGIPIPAEVEPPTTAWGLTPWGALLLVFIAVMRGWLVPGRTVALIERDRDEWKATALKAMDQNAQLLTMGRPVASVLEAIPAQKTPSGGE